MYFSNKGSILMTNLLLVIENEAVFIDLSRVSEYLPLDTCIIHTAPVVKSTCQSLIRLCFWAITYLCANYFRFERHFSVRLISVFPNTDTIYDTLPTKI